MTPQSKLFQEQVIRHLKGLIGAWETWLKSHN